MVNKQNKTTMIVMAAIVIGIIWFVTTMEQECVTDDDCSGDLVCNMDGECADFIPVKVRDNVCPDNIAGWGYYDADCPAYCPLPQEIEGRASGARVCCSETYGEDLYLMVDCDTREPTNLFPEVTFDIPEQRPPQTWYDDLLMAVFKFGEQPYKKFTGNIHMAVSITTGDAPLGASSYDVYLDSTPTVKTNPGGVAEPRFTAVWASCTILGNSCTGSAGKVNVAEGLTDQTAWMTDPVVAENYLPAEYGTYLATFSYAGDEQPPVEGISTSHPSDMEYDLIIGSDVLDFSISVGLSS